MHSHSQLLYDSVVGRVVVTPDARARPFDLCHKNRQQTDRWQMSPRTTDVQITPSTRPLKHPEMTSADL